MLAVEVVGQLADGRAVETPQNHAAATYAPKIERHEGLIDWSQPAARIHNLVRGLQPWPLVSARLGETRCLIYRTVVTGERSTRPPGTIGPTAEGVLQVATGDLDLRILEIQPEGKRVMMARDFLAGRRIAAGARFS